MIFRVEIKNDWVVSGLCGDGLEKVCLIKDFPWDVVETCCNELIIHDVTASLFESGCDPTCVSLVRDRLNIPITFAGGVKDASDIEIALQAGCDRVGIGSMLFCAEGPEIISKLRDSYGLSTLLLCLEIPEHFSLNLTDRFNFQRGRMTDELVALDRLKTISQLGEFEVFLLDLWSQGTDRSLRSPVLKTITEAYVGSCVVEEGLFRGGESLFDGVRDSIASRRILKDLKLV